MRKIAVALSKGGVGKTTTAVNLAAGLADQKQSVLLVDMDTQGQVAQAFGVQPERGLTEVATGDCTPAEGITAVRPNIDLLAGGLALAGLKRLIARQDFGGERTVAQALQPLDDQYDFVIIDTAPGWDSLSVNALFYAHEILTPVSLEVMSLQGLLAFHQSVASIQQYHTALRLRYIVPTFMDRRVKKSAEILGQLQAHFPDQICDPIRYNVRLSEAPGYGQPIFEYAAKSTGAQDYSALTKRVIKDV